MSILRKKIETEISTQENADEEVIVADEITETAEIDLPDLENATPEEALGTIIKIQAEETVRNLKENSKNQPNNEEDVDFGLVPEKPIYTLALMSVDGKVIKEVDVSEEDLPKKISVPLNNGLQLKIIYNGGYVGLGNIIVK